MANTILHFTFFAAVALYVITLIFQLTMFKMKQNRKYSFRNELPFELVQGVDVRYGLIQNVLLFLVTVAQVVFAFNYFPTLIMWYEYLLVAGFVLSSIMVYLLHFVRVFEIKKHIIVMLLQGLGVFTSFLALGIFMQFNIYDRQSLPFAIILYVLAFLSLLILFNSKLRSWPIMDKRVQQDGTVLILRPKTFLLAVYEWIYIALHFVAFITMYIYCYF